MEHDAKCPDTLVNAAHQAADHIAAVHRRYFRNHYTFEVKADGSPVTQADKEAEQVFRDFIGRRFPEHGIIGEEYPPHQPDAEYVWVIDPIDGTHLFMSGKPLFALLLAFSWHGRFILGIIEHAMMGERW